MKEYKAQEISYGTDAVFHVVFDYDKADRLSVQGTLLTDLQRIQKGDVNFNEVLNLSVSLEIGSCFPTALPMGESKAWRIDELYPNRLIIEIPAEKQALGNVYAVIQFDVPSDKLKDGLFHQERRIHLCNIVRPEQTQKVYKYPSSEHILLLSQGEPSIPTSNFERGRNLIVMSRMVQGDFMNRSNIGHEFSPAIYDPVFIPVAPNDIFLFNNWEDRAYQYLTSDTYRDGVARAFVLFYNAKKMEIERIILQQKNYYFYYQGAKNDIQQYQDIRIIAPAKAMYMRISLLHPYQRAKLEWLPIEGGSRTPFSLSPEDKAVGYKSLIEEQKPLYNLDIKPTIIIED